MAVGHLPADGTQPATQGIPAALILGALGFDRFQWTGEGGDGGLLDGNEHPEINLGAQLFAGGHHIGAAHQKADAGAGDVEALAQREELHRTALCAGNVEDAVALSAVKDDVAVGVVMDEKDVIRVTEIHDFLINFRRSYAAHRVGGERHNHVFGLAGDFGGDVGHMGQKAVFAAQRVIIGHAAAQPGTGDKDGVAGIRQEHGVALVEQSKAQMPDAVLAARKAHHPVRRDGIDAEPALVVGTDGVQQLGQVPQGILPVLAVSGGIHEGLPDMGHRRKVRRTHREVIQLFALGFQGHFFVVERGENLRSKQIQSF